MAIIVPPPTDTQDKIQPPTHPDIPECGDDEDFVVYLGRVSDVLCETPPPAPRGFMLIPCEASPRHYPEYRVAEDVFYPAPCLTCQFDATYRDLCEARCKLQHRRWKSWRAWGWLSSKGYVLGVIGSCGTSYGRCEFCGIGRQHHRPRWTGKRSYILGVSTDTWACLRRGHRRQESHWSGGICTVCLPCPECESTAPEHFSCEVGT